MLLEMSGNLILGHGSIVVAPNITFKTCRKTSTRNNPIGSELTSALNSLVKYDRDHRDCVLAIFALSFLSPVYCILRLHRLHIRVHTMCALEYCTNS